MTHHIAVIKKQSRRTNASVGSAARYFAEKKIMDLSQLKV